jgi:hypothetical protein
MDDDDFPRGPGDGDAYGYPGQAEAELEADIRKSVGMREKDQSDALLQFGKDNNADRLKAISDESRELFVKDLIRISKEYHDHNCNK